MGLKDKIDKNYKYLIILPILLIILSIAQISYQVYSTGDFVDKGIALKGGHTIRIDTSYSDVLTLKEALSDKFPKEDFDVRASTTRGVQDALIIEATEGASIDDVLIEIKSVLGDQAPSIETMASEVGTVSSAFSTGFFKSALLALLFAFLFMSIVVFYYFRIFIPSLAVVLAVVSDIIFTLAVFNLLGMKLSTGGIAAFLMLIGYSVDTDILLSTKVLKQGHGTVSQRIWSCMKTGMTMTITALAAALVGFIFTNSEVVKEIMLILVIGLVADIIMTWFQNAVILKWYLEKKNKAVENNV